MRRLNRSRRSPWPRCVTGLIVFLISILFILPSASAHEVKISYDRREALYPEFGFTAYTDAIGLHAKLRGLIDLYHAVAPHLVPFTGFSLAYSYTQDAKHTEQDFFGMIEGGLYYSPFEDGDTALSKFVFGAGLNLGSGYTYDKYVSGKANGVVGMLLEPMLRIEYRLAKLRFCFASGYRFVFYGTTFKNTWITSIGGMYVIREEKKP